MKSNLWDLINQMTIEEKLGQLYQIHKGDQSLDGSIEAAIRNGHVGSVININDAKESNRFQKIAIEESRLGIPLIMARDVIHGFRTIFPIPLGQASSWNLDKLRESCRIAAIEASSAGIHWTFAPSVDVCRDARWGRISETFGEDTFLVSECGKAAIEGYQGESLRNKESIAACAKHFVGYGAVEGGRDYNIVCLPEVELREVHLKPFHSAVSSNVASIMSAFNEINGIPCSGNPTLLRDILREEWNFNGMVVSDWDSIKEMIVHGFCEDEAQAAELALKAGINMEMVSRTYLENTKALLNEKRISESLIDKLVYDVLNLKDNLGLFDDAFTLDVSKADNIQSSHLQLAQQIAEESIMLFENKNNILPIGKKNQKICLLGPLSNAHHDQLGTWVFDGQKEDTITPLKAFSEFYGRENISHHDVLEYSRDNQTNNFAEALSLASDADLVILFLGEESIITGEAHSRAVIDLPGAQKQLFREIKSLKTPLITVILAGRPLEIEEIKDESDALLYAFHPGTMGGAAICNLISGQSNPSAKSPVSFPISSSQIPIYYNHKNTGRPATKETYVSMENIKVGTKQTELPNTSQYLDFGYKALIPFGYGLSYSEFIYLEVSMDKAQMKTNEKLTVNVLIKNDSDIPGYEIVQLYIRDLVGSRTRPVKELKAFKKLFFNAKEKKEVSFTLDNNDFSFFRQDLSFGSERGKFHIMVGPNSEELLQREFELI